MSGVVGFKADAGVVASGVAEKDAGDVVGIQGVPSACMLVSRAMCQRGTRA